MYHFEAVDQMYRDYGQTNTFLMIEGFLIRLCLLGLILYFIMNELIQIKRASSIIDYISDFWNIIDWTPLILLIVSLLLSSID